MARRHLLAEGATRREIAGRLARGALITMHPGVYRVGHAAPSVLATYVAAVLACGDGAALARFAAAHLHRLQKFPPSVITVLTPTERQVRGVSTIRSRVLGGKEVVVVRGIRVTTVARTLVDLAPVLPPADYARLCHEAGIRHKTTPRHVQKILDRHPKSPGIAQIRRVMSGEEKVTLSQLEARFLELLRTKALPLPVTNRARDGRRLDCRWADRRLSVELDSFAFHNSRHSWEQDRLREREAYERGDDFRRYTWGDVTEDPRRMLRELRALLSCPGHRTGA